MENPENLDSPLIDSISNDVGCADNHQFPRPLNPARTSQLAVIQQPGHLTFYLVTLLYRGNRVVFGDVVDDLIEIMQRLGEPLQLHGAGVPACLASACRLAAHRSRTVVWGTQAVSGLSASASAASTWLRNQRSCSTASACGNLT